MLWNILFILPFILAKQSKQATSFRNTAVRTASQENFKVLIETQTKSGSIPNVFELPEDFRVTKFHKDHPLFETQSTTAGYLYAWMQFYYSPYDDYSYAYYYDDTCLNYLEPNFATGVIMNTCLTGIKANSSTSYSMVYTCEGSVARKSIFAGTDCNPGSPLNNVTFPLHQCTSFLDEAVLTFGCSPYTNNLPLPPAPSTAPTNAPSSTPTPNPSSSWLTKQ
jgi:hypothetical protein